MLFHVSTTGKKNPQNLVDSPEAMKLDLCLLPPQWVPQPYILQGCAMRVCEQIAETLTVIPINPCCDPTLAHTAAKWLATCLRF